MLPKLGVHDPAWLPEPASGVRSVNFDYELLAWFEEEEQEEEEQAAPPPTQRTEAVAAPAPPPSSGRIPFLIF
jgi:hypothetical protein